jgi:peptidoglycan hydrolase-like protein with peptidoglycan-binding domain
VLPGAPVDKDETAEPATLGPPPIQPPEVPQTAKTAPDAKTARVRPTGEDRVRRLQAALTRRGFYHGPLDGIADARTVQAILAYQISVGDPPSGTLTQTEIIRMLNNG